MFIILQLRFAERVVLKIGEYHSGFSWGILSHVTRFDQSVASENI